MESKEKNFMKIFSFLLTMGISIGMIVGIVVHPNWITDASGYNEVVASGLYFASLGALTSIILTFFAYQISKIYNVFKSKQTKKRINKNKIKEILAEQEYILEKQNSVLNLMGKSQNNGEFSIHKRVYDKLQLSYLSNQKEIETLRGTK